VITDKGILESDPETGEMVLAAIYPDVAVEDVKSSVGWPLQVREHLDLIAPPGAEELRLLREVLDPKKLYLG